MYLMYYIVIQGCYVRQTQRNVILIRVKTEERVRMESTDITVLAMNQESITILGKTVKQPSAM